MFVGWNLTLAWLVDKPSPLNNLNFNYERDDGCIKLRYLSWASSG